MVEIPAADVIKYMQLIALKFKIKNCARLDDAECLIQGVILGFCNPLRRFVFFVGKM
jgi:hypothetical protein